GIFKRRPDGAQTLFTRVFDRGLGLAFDSAGNLYATENADGVLFVFDHAGNAIHIIDGVQSPIHLAFEPGPSNGRPLNLSTRGLIQTGDNVLIGGVITGGTVGKKVLLRGIGPSLTPFGVAGALPNPRLDLFDQAGTR